MSKDGSSLKKLKGWLRGHSKSSSSSRTDSSSPAPAAAPKVAGVDNARLPLESTPGMCFPHFCKILIADGYGPVSEPVLPWAEWEVQDGFLQKLNEWNRNNSQSSLDSVMKKIQDRLSKIGTVLESELVTEIMGFIPNSPFPAGQLVKCLLSVFMISVVGNSETQCM
jgi:hypothetical protein